MRRSLAVALGCSAVLGQAQSPGLHELAQRVNYRYNHLSTLRASFTEEYRGMGQQRQEHGTLLLKKPGRMRWTYADGKLFVLDGKYATSYTPGDPQAQRIPAKQLDDLRSPLRFLLGHTEVEKELDHLSAAPGPNGTVTLSGVPRFAAGARNGESRVQAVALTVVPQTGMIVGLRLTEVDGSVTDFRFDQLEQDVPAPESDFRFSAPASITVVDGLPPA